MSRLTIWGAQTSVFRHNFALFFFFAPNWISNHIGITLNFLWSLFFSPPDYKQLDTFNFFPFSLDKFDSLCEQRLQRTMGYVCTHTQSHFHSLHVHMFPFNLKTTKKKGHFWGISIFPGDNGIRAVSPPSITH